MPSHAETTTQEYERRINRVIDYISAHLADDLPLETLARVAPFSKFHFHRLFRAWTGETLQTFIRRLRLERSAHLLLFDRRSSITDIAFRCGFSSSQNFAKSFKPHFGKSPSQYRREFDFRDTEAFDRRFGNGDSNPGNMDRKEGEDFPGVSVYLPDSMLRMPSNGPEADRREDRRKSMNIEVRQIPGIRVAYVRHIGPYGPQSIGPLFEKLMRWVGPRGLCHEGAVIIGMSWDNPEITPPEKCRYDACIGVSEDFVPEGEIGVETIPAGQYAVYHCEVFNNDFETPWNALMRDWLPSSGYQPADQPCFERYYNDAANDPEGKWIVDLCMPVKPF